MLVVLVFGRVQFDSFNEVTATIEEQYDLLLLSQNMRRDIKDEAIALRNLFIYQDEGLMQQEIDKINELNKQTLENIELLRSLAQTEEQVHTVSQLNSVVNSFHDYQKELIPTILAGNNEEAIRLMNENANTLEEQLQTAVNDLTSAIELRVLNTIDTESVTFTRGVIFETVIIALLSFLIILVLFRIIWTATKRLSSVANVMKGIANEELALTTEVEVVGNDEVDAVATSFNQMTSTFAKQQELE